MERSGIYSRQWTVGIQRWVLYLFVYLLVFNGIGFATSQSKEVSSKVPDAKGIPAKPLDTKTDGKTEHKNDPAKSAKEEEKSAESTLIQLLEKKKVDLEAKERELKEREARLDQMGKDIDAKIVEYGKLRQTLENSFKKLDSAQAEKIAGLVKIYESMPPKEAAARLQALDEDIALLVFSKMKQKSAAKVLALIEPVRAAALSQGLLKVGNPKFK